MRLGPAFFLLLALTTAPLLAKRQPPPKVEPIHHAGVVYTACPQVSKMGLIEAWDEVSGQKLWEKRIYTIHLVPMIEQDTQWVFISSMTLEGNTLLITNERGSSYTLDLKTKEVERVKKPKVEENRQRNP